MNRFDSANRHVSYIEAALIISSKSHYIEKLPNSHYSYQIVHFPITQMTLEYSQK